MWWNIIIHSLYFFFLLFSNIKLADGWRGVDKKGSGIGAIGVVRTTTRQYCYQTTSIKDVRLVKTLPPRNYRECRGVSLPSGRKGEGHAAVYIEGSREARHSSALHPSSDMNALVTRLFVVSVYLCSQLLQSLSTVLLSRGAPRPQAGYLYL